VKRILLVMTMQELDCTLCDALGSAFGAASADIISAWSQMLSLGLSMYEFVSNM